MLRKLGLNDTAETALILQSRCSTSLYLALIFVLAIKNSQLVCRFMYNKIPVVHKNNSLMYMLLNNIIMYWRTAASFSCWLLFSNICLVVLLYTTFQILGESPSIIPEKAVAALRPNQCSSRSWDLGHLSQIQCKGKKSNPLNCLSYRPLESSSSLKGGCLHRKREWMGKSMWKAVPYNKRSNERITFSPPTGIALVGSHFICANKQPPLPKYLFETHPDFQIKGDAASTKSR